MHPQAKAFKIIVLPIIKLPGKRFDSNGKTGYKRGGWVYLTKRREFPSANSPGYTATLARTGEAIFREPLP